MNYDGSRVKKTGQAGRLEREDPAKAKLVDKLIRQNSAELECEGGSLPRDPIFGGNEEREKRKRRK